MSCPVDSKIVRVWYSCDISIACQKTLRRIHMCDRETRTGRSGALCSPSEVHETQVPNWSACTACSLRVAMRECFTPRNTSTLRYHMERGRSLFMSPMSCFRTCIYMDLEHLYLFIMLSFFIERLLSELAMCFSRSPKITLLLSMKTLILLPLMSATTYMLLDESAGLSCT